MQAGLLWFIFLSGFTDPWVLTHPSAESQTPALSDWKDNSCFWEHTHLGVQRSPFHSWLSISLACLPPFKLLKFPLVSEEVPGRAECPLQRFLGTARRCHCLPPSAARHCQGRDAHWSVTLWHSCPGQCHCAGRMRWPLCVVITENPAAYASGAFRGGLNKVPGGWSACLTILCIGDLGKIALLTCRWLWPQPLAQASNMSM